MANLAELDLSPRRFRTRFAGLFLFLPITLRRRSPKMMEGPIRQLTAADLGHEHPTLRTPDPAREFRSNPD